MHTQSAVVLCHTELQHKWPQGATPRGALRPGGHRTTADEGCNIMCHLANPELCSLNFQPVDGLGQQHPLLIYQPVLHNACSLAVSCPHTSCSPSLVLASDDESLSDDELEETKAGWGGNPLIV